jgi:hypothetical protein
MDPIAVIAGAVEGLKALKEIKGISDKVREAKYENIIADLTLAQVDLKREMATLKDENLRLTGELNRAKAQPDLSENLTMRDGVLFPKVPIPGKGPGPFCSRCHEVEGKLITATKVVDPWTHFGKYKCPNCKSYFS